MPLSHLFNRAGGLLYHMSAARARRRWRFHRAMTAAWLDEWRPRHSHLVLLGPSGGYALPAEFLLGFGRVTAIDPDPLAAGILKLRFGRVAWEFSDEDFLFTDDRRLDATGFARLAAAFPEAAFLFCNILGQLPFLAADADQDREAWTEAFRRFQSEREWASFHDLWSAATRCPGIQWTPPPMGGEARVRQSIKEFGLSGSVREIRDHRTANLFDPAAPRRLWTWQRGPAELHCVEGVRASRQLE